MITPGVTAGEAVANVATGASRTFLLVALATAMLGVSLLVDAREVQTIRRREAELLRAGGSSFVVESSGNVDQEACDGLGAARSVIAAGSFRPSDDIRTVEVQGQESVSVWYSSPGGLQALASLGALNIPQQTPEATVARIWSTAALSESVGLSTTRGPFPIEASSISYRVIGLIELSSIVPRATGSAILVESAGAASAPHRPWADFCLVIARPGHTETAKALAAVVAPLASMEDRTFSDLVFQSSLAFDPISEMTERPSRWAWLAGAVTLPMLWSAILITRRAETGLYLSVGLARSEILRLRLVEGLILLASVLAGTLLMIVSVATADAAARPLLQPVLLPQIVASSGLSGLLVVVVASLSVVSGTGAELVRDR
jgi:hypothetical protein